VREEETVESLRSKVVVLAMQPSRKRKQEAIDLLNRMDQRQPLTAEDQFLLIQLHEQLGDKHKARARLERLLAREGEVPRYVAYQVRVLLRQGFSTDAEKWLQVLEGAAPKAWETLELKARLVAAQGQSNESVALLKNLVKIKSPQAWLAAAELLEEIGQGSAAAKLYRRYAAESQSPERVLVLARYLGRQGNVEEALRLCADAERACTPEAVGYARLAILHAGRATAEHCLSVKKSLESARQRYPKAIGLLICLADLADLQGEYRVAERLYRECLVAAPRNGEALNNLAWQLAVRAGRGKEALQLADTALAVLGALPEVRDTRALALLADGQADQAVAELRDLILTSTDRKTLASIQFHLARAYQMGGKKEEALLALKEAKQLGLREASLHPLERPVLEKLTAELK
jgi:predicted Zn-dependent protease